MRIRGLKYKILRLKVFAVTALLCFSFVTGHFGAFTYASSDTAEKASVSEYKDPDILEEDLMEFYQVNIEAMKSEFAFSFKGNADVRSFLEENTSFYVDCFSRQIADMRSDNHNGYTGLATTGNISFQLKTSETSSFYQVEITVKITWADQSLPGMTALQAREAVAAHAQKFLDSEQYPKEGTHEEKLRAINKYICETFQYDYRLWSETEQDDVIYTAYKMITDSDAIGGYPRGVCQAYAMYGFMMLKQAGYKDVIIVQGNSSITGENHAWNMVKVGGNWYHADFTWNDPISSEINRQDGAGTVSFDYFMLSDDEIAADHSWPEIKDGFDYPKAPEPWPEGGPAPDITEPAQTPSVSPTLSPSPEPTAVPTKIPANSPTQEEPDSDPGTSADPDPSVISMIYPSKTDIPSDKGSGGSQEPRVSIYGKIYDAKDKPLNSMKLMLFASGQTALTDIDGGYSFDDVRIGSYKIQLLDINDDILAELPIVITFGDRTYQSGGSVTVKGGKLTMDLRYDNGVLSVMQVSSPGIELTTTAIIVSSLLILALLTTFVILLARRKSGVPQ